MNNRKRKFVFYAAELMLLCFLIFFDQWTKAEAVAALKGKPFIPLIPGALELYYLENTGAAFSMLENAQWFFCIVAVAAAAVIAWFILRIPSVKRMVPLHICLIFIAAGAVGNLIDRLQLHYVRDFIYISLIHFPVFNVADMYVTVCTALLVIYVLFVYKDEDFAFLHREGKPQSQDHLPE